MRGWSAISECPAPIVAKRDADNNLTKRCAVTFQGIRAIVGVLRRLLKPRKVEITCFLSFSAWYPCPDSNRGARFRNAVRRFNRQISFDQRLAGHGGIGRIGLCP